MEKKRLIKIAIYLSICSLTLLYALTAFCQFYEEADYASVKDTRKNALGGYDYYDENGELIGYSDRTAKGDYIYYDNAGNITGRLKKTEDGKYVFYNASGVKTGTLKKTPVAGQYRYQGNFESGLKGYTPPPGEDIGYFPASSFQEQGLESGQEE